jgi:hypothetical protein
MRTIRVNNIPACGSRWVEEIIPREGKELRLDECREPRAVTREPPRVNSFAAGVVLSGLFALANYDQTLPDGVITWKRLPLVITSQLLRNRIYRLQTLRRLRHNYRDGESRQRGDVCLPGSLILQG